MNKKFQPKQMLVTGGAGFIGSHFIRHTLKHNPSVNIMNLDALTYAGSLNYLQALPDPARHHFIHGNICDRALLKELFETYQIDTVVHFAAESHVDRSIAAPEAFIETNLVGTFRLLEQARIFWKEQHRWTAEHCRFHHISTDEVYGDLTHTDPAFTEQTPYAPHSPYSASKAGSDHLVRAYHRTYGLPITVSNCSNNYGPHQHPEKFIPTIIHACLNQKPIPVYGDGQQIRDWLYVTDHCEAITKIIESGIVGETYNIGGNNEKTNLEVVHLICDLMDAHHPQSHPHRSLIQFVTDRPGHDYRYAMNSSKLQEALGWKPRTSFADGLDQTLQIMLQSNDLYLFT